MKGVKYTKNANSLPLTVLKTPKMRILKAIDMEAHTKKGLRKIIYLKFYLVNKRVIIKYFL